MLDGTNLVPYDSGIQFGTKYLTKETAYFLGNIFASDESVQNGNIKYWIAPVRYNYKYATELEIEEHFEYVKTMTAKLGAQTVMAENVRGTFLDSGKFRLLGFGSFFESSGLTDLSGAIPSLKEALTKSSQDVKQSFMAGVFDGRGSIDINKTTNSIRYIVLDCPTDELGNFLFELFENEGLPCNYNTARDRLVGEPRKAQLRIKNSEKYMRKVGFISPKRFNLVLNAYQHMYYSVNTVENSSILPGLKTIIVR